MKTNTRIALGAIAAIGVTAGIVTILNKTPEPQKAPLAPKVIATKPVAAPLVATGVPVPVATPKAKQHPHATKADILEPLVPSQAPEAALRSANLDIRNLEVRNVGGIVILKGKADTKSVADQAEKAVHEAGYARVANLIQTEAVTDDDAIRRDVERQLTMSRSLDGCKFVVSCDRGILKVSARIQSDLQEDATRLMLKQVRGAREVQATFARF